MTVESPQGRDVLESPESTVLMTLSRGLSVLEAIAERGGRATPKTLARQLGLKQATCYNLLRTLRAEGYVIRLPDGTFDVGPRGHALGKGLTSRTAPTPAIAAILARLHNKTRETSYVCGWFHGTILRQQVISGQQSLIVKNLDVGYVGNMHARASCQAILAYLPLSHVRTMFEGTDLPKLTPNTIGTFDELAEELEAIRRREHALDLEAFEKDVCCVAAPFFDASGAPVGSFTVSVPVSRFGAAQRSLVNEVREAGAMATNLLRTGSLVSPGTHLAADQ